MYVYNPLNLPFLRNDVVNPRFMMTGGGGLEYGLHSGTTVPGQNEAGMWIQPTMNGDGWIWAGIIDNRHALIPKNHCYFGSPNHPWKHLYVGSIFSTPKFATISDFYLKNCRQVSTSDRNLKKDIELINRDDIKGFLKELMPAWYRLIDDPENIHTGLIAQDVEPLIEKYNLPSDWSFFYKKAKKNEDGKEVEGEYEYMLDYTQLIIPLLVMIQELL